jgi:hypothetical protein
MHARSDEFRLPVVPLVTTRAMMGLSGQKGQRILPKNCHFLRRPAPGGGVLFDARA